MSANIVGLPDYDDSAYQEPRYNYGEAFYDANRARYTSWRKLWAKRDLHEAGEDYDPRNPDKPLIWVIDLLHHPNFPEVLQHKLIGFSSEQESLHPVDVKDFMESKYAYQLERPDWEYLVEILTHVEEAVPSPVPQTVKQARQWLEAKRTTLLAWPPILSEPDAKGRRIRRDDVFAFDRSARAGAKPQTKIDDLVRAPLTLPLLIELLNDLKLLDEHNAEGAMANSSATPGAWGGLVLMLHKSKLLVGHAATIHEVLKATFKAEVSAKTISNAIKGDGYQAIYHSQFVLSHLKSMNLIK